VKPSKQESNVEVVVRQGPSPIVEIILKSGTTSLFRTTLSFPNMAMAEEYAQYMAQGMGVSYDIIYSSHKCAQTRA
jgi:hypothetical protein